LTAANEHLHRANMERQAVIQATPLAIWALDLDGNVTFWNPAAERIFGWTEAEVIGRPLPVVPGDLGDEYQQWLKRFRAGEALVGVERKRRKRDGSLIDVAIWTAPLRDASGNITGAIAIDNDITQHRILEDQLRQSQKLEAVGQLAGGVAHDFNNLLTVIMGYAEMLMDATRGTDLYEYTQEVQGAANRASSLTAQLLAFSRRQISQPSVLALNEIVTHSMKMLRRVIGEDIEVATHLDANLEPVRADPHQIDQLILNLVVNARDAMSKGGRLTIDTAMVELDENYVGRHIGVKPGFYAMLAISDNGIGMDALTLSRLFEPFFTTKESGKGTGLGLSIVYGIVKQNHGEILVYSEPGHGTTFKIYLPVVQGSERMAAAENGSPQPRGTETILLCEDEIAIRRLVESMLSRLGYHVIAVETPEEAIAMARDFDGPIDLLLTDVVMPGMSGFDMSDSVRDLRPQIKTLFMSGYTDNRVNSGWAMHSGMPFLQKPFTASSLGRKVRESLGAAAAP
jgi:two-component system, cell cycle sensor histidine kinase and response regulator CckA